MFKMKEFEKYVKVSHSDKMHTALFKVADVCNQLTSGTSELRNLEAEKYRVYADAKGVSRSLLDDLKALSGYFGEPSDLILEQNNSHKPAPKKAPKPVRRAKRPLPKRAPARRTTTKRAVAKRARTKSKPQPKPKTSVDTANLKRLKANLDAIRASLK